MQVEGAPVSGMPIKVHAAYDPITAAECEVADGFDPKMPLVAGASTQLVIQVRLLRHCLLLVSVYELQTGALRTGGFRGVWCQLLTAGSFRILWSFIFSPTESVLCHSSTA